MGLIVALLALLPACERSDPRAQSQAGAPVRDQVQPRTPKPDYAFAVGLEEQYPEVVGFLRHFLETALAGDYAGYRRLVSRAADPESRERFEKILNSLQTLTVESIEQIELPQLPSPTYLVTSQVDFLPGQKIALRRGNNREVAILVFEEEDELRMMVAPSELQPAEPEHQQPGPTTASSAPSYPWQQDADY